MYDVLYCICTSLGPVICEPSYLDKVKKIIDFTSNISTSSLHVEKWMDYLGTNYHEQISRPGVKNLGSKGETFAPPPPKHTY